jgi:hypothetical protein
LPVVCLLLLLPAAAAAAGPGAVRWPWLLLSQPAGEHESWQQLSAAAAAAGLSQQGGPCDLCLWAQQQVRHALQFYLCWLHSARGTLFNPQREDVHGHYESRHMLRTVLAAGRVTQQGLGDLKVFVWAGAMALQGRVTWVGRCDRDVCRALTLGGAGRVAHTLCLGC